MKRKSRLSFGVIAALAFLLVLSGIPWGAPATQAAALFSDNFENGSGNWTATTGTWSVVQDGGSQVYAQTSSSEGRTSAGSSSWSDYSVQANVKIESFNGSNRTYVTGRYRDGNNYYAASLSGSNGGTLELRKKVSGSSTTLVSKANYPLSTGVWYTVKLELNGSSLKMYVNGNLELTATDSALTAGAVGLIAFKTSAKFDNVEVSGLSGTPTPTPTATPTAQPSASPSPTPAPTTPGTLSGYNLTGFGSSNPGGGIISESDTALYRKVYTATDLAAALKRNSGVKVVEIMNDLDLGWNEIPSAAQAAPFTAHNSPQTHPVLLQTGVSKITVDGFNGLTIFSANGAKIKHAALVFKRSSNVVIRNLEFDELWEWDEASKGDYDKNDWDYITLEENSNVWIDHCTFNKAYDGVVDSKKGTSGVTISWSLFRGDDRGSNSWVTQQINALEANPSAYPMYAYLRSSAVGLSKNDIIAIVSSQKKGHLVGANSLDSSNASLTITLHHNYYIDMQDRLPRLRGGNAHVYNVLVDNSAAREAYKRITPAMASAISSKGYKFSVTSNGAISTEGGAVLVEKSNFIDIVYPVRNNQTNPSDSQYTGKIKAMDTMYSLDGAAFRGDSDTAGSPLAPVPAPVIAFSWSGISSLPYSYTADDPAGLAGQLTASGGAGAGKLSWDKTNWLKTQY